MTPDAPRLAAVVFDPREAVDLCIRAALDGFAGRRILGWLQGYEVEDRCECSDIVLTAIHGGARRSITQNLGSGSQGCRLDNAALAEVAGWLAADLADPPDLLVLNRFGKTEAEGGGLRGVLEQALALDVPVLVPVNRKQLAFWRDYAGDLAEELPCDTGAVRAWVAAVLGADQPCSMVKTVAAPSLV